MTSEVDVIMIARDTAYQLIANANAKVQAGELSLEGAIHEIEEYASRPIQANISGLLQWQRAVAAAAFYPVLSDYIRALKQVAGEASQDDKEAQCCSLG
jgi:hypothetical protein